MKYLLLAAVLLATPISAQIPIALDSTDTPIQLGQYAQPKIYEAWWQEIAACEKLTLPADHSVTWIVVPARPFRFSTEKEKLWLDAATLSPDVRIYINQTALFNEMLIKHEMTHALLFWKYGTKYVKGSLNSTHPAPYFNQCDLTTRDQQID